ncbi:MAG: ATP-binding protein, partial [candidate division NC10 bacterium]|nr:ATP-binding protein [candidate division NC10 bacterium]
MSEVFEAQDQMITKLERERNLYARTLTEITRRYEEKIEELSLIRRTSDLLRDALDVDSTCWALVESVLEEIGAEGCRLMLLDAASGSLHVKVARGVTGKSGISGDQGGLPMRIPIGHGPMSRAIVEKRPILTMEGDSPSLYLPIASREEVIALFALHGSTAEIFNDNTIRIMTIILNHAAVAIEKAKLYQDLKDYSENLEAKVRERTQELQLLIGRIEGTSRHKSQFLANMSHELRTPLNAVIGFSDLLMAQSVGTLNEKQTRYVSHIHTSGLDLLTLINDILDLSKIEAGRMELEPEAVSIDESLKAYIEMVRPLAQKKKLTVTLSVEPDLTQVWADPARLQRIVYNLLSNAIKFTPAGGTVTVAARGVQGSQFTVHGAPAAGSEPSAVIREPRRDFVEISVQDTGIGIRSEDQDRIFLEFEQVEGTHQRQQQGTGLGLALAKQLVELLGGKIWVVTQVGKGSTFTF